MFLWIFSKYSKQPLYRALPDGCLSTNGTKIIWISNHAFSAARQRVLYYDRPVYFWNPVYWKGPMNSAQSVCSSAHLWHTFFGIHLLAFLDIGEGLSFIRGSKVAKLSFLEKFLFWKKRLEKVKSDLKIKLLDLTENQVIRVVWK